jgi:tetratricopeptide (TPR) repeat protein
VSLQVLTYWIDEHDPIVSNSTSLFQNQALTGYEGGGDIAISDQSPRDAKFEADAWPFASNSTNAEPELLLHLFAALRITPPDDLTIYLKPKLNAVEQNSAQPEYISNTQFNDLTSGANNCQEVTSFSARKNISHQTSQSSPPSLCKDLYIFQAPVPTSRVSHNLSAPQRETQISIWNGQLAVYIDNLSKLQRAGFDSHPAVLSTMRSLAQINLAMGKIDAAETWYRRITAMYESQPTENHRYWYLNDNMEFIEVLVLQGQITNAKKLLNKISSQIHRYDSKEHVLLQASLRIQAHLATEEGKFEYARSCNRQIIQIELYQGGPWKGSIIEDVLHVAADIINNKDNSGEALDLLNIALKIQEISGYVSLYHRVSTFIQIARALSMSKRFAEAKVLLSKVVETAETHLGVEHSSTMRTTLELAIIYREEGFHEKSEHMLRNLLAIMEPHRGSEDIGTVHVKVEHCRSLIGMHRYDEGVLLLDTVFNESLDRLYENSSIMFYCGFTLVDCLLSQARDREAIPVLQHMLRAIFESQGTEHDYFYDTCHELAACYEREKMYLDAIALHVETVQLLEARNEPYDKDWLYFCVSLATYYEDGMQYADAAEIYKKIIQSIETGIEQRYSDTLPIRRQLGRCYEKRGDFLDAIDLYEDTLQIVHDRQPQLEATYLDCFKQHLADCFRKSGQQYEDAKIASFQTLESSGPEGVTQLSDMSEEQSVGESEESQKVDADVEAQYQFVYGVREILPNTD